MKWFKHICASYNDESLSKMTDELGMEGYGFWWRTLEVIAEKMDETDNHSCTFSAKKWGNFYGFSAKKFEKFARIFEKFGLLFVEISENSITISAPNLAEYKDEWSKKKARNSGVTPKELRRKEEDIDIDNINTPLYPPKGGEQVLFVPEVPAQKPSRAKRKPKGADLPPYTDEFEQLWKEYPRKDGKGNAYRAYLELSEAGVLPEHEDFKQRIISRRYEPDWEKDDGRYVPHMATWLHRNGWEDEGCQWRTQATNNRQDEFEAILDSYSWAPKRDEYQHPERLHERERQLTEALKAAGF